MDPYENPQYLTMQSKLTNAPTAQEVRSIMTEAAHKGWDGLVLEGRQILLQSFGYQKAVNGKLISPNEIHHIHE